MDWKQILTELVSFVKEAAPAMWQIYRRQVYVSAAQRAVFSLFLFLAAFKLQRADSENEGWGVFLGVILTTGALLLLLGAIGEVLNPDYQVIQMMLLTIR